MLSLFYYNSILTLYSFKQLKHTISLVKLYCFSVDIYLKNNIKTNKLTQNKHRVTFT